MIAYPAAVLRHGGCFGARAEVVFQVLPQLTKGDDYPLARVDPESGIQQGFALVATAGKHEPECGMLAKQGGIAHPQRQPRLVAVLRGHEDLLPIEASIDLRAAGTDVGVDSRACGAWFAKVRERWVLW